jgi:3-hydroxybutyryl-CoA dehydrogenase
VNSQITSDSIQHVGVVGSGTMGRGIAESCLRAGLYVALYDTSPDALNLAREQIGSAIQRSVDKNRTTPADAQSWLGNLHIFESIDALSTCELVIEAVPEILNLKRDVLSQVEQSVNSKAIIATNTSSIPITKLSGALADSSRFVGLHFFNPVPKMNLVEIITTVRTNKVTVRTIERFVSEALHKTPLTIADRPGFVVNALLVPYLLAAARMLDSGYATAKKIDEGMKLGCGYPLGPLELLDLIGLDVICDVADSLYAETKDPANVVPNNLRRLVEAGYLGRKTGRGLLNHQVAAS